MSNSHTGIKMSNDARKNMSKAQSGPNHPMWGKSHSEQTKNKMSLQRRGEKHPSCKLNEKQVREIKLRLSQGVDSQQQIADVFHVTQATISDIKTGKRWRHLRKVQKDPDVSS